MRTFVTALAVATVAIGTTACASKKYVRSSVGEVNDKVDSLGRSIEQTQERVKANEGKIAEVFIRGRWSVLFTEAEVNWEKFRELKGNPSQWVRWILKKGVRKLRTMHR